MQLNAAQYNNTGNNTHLDQTHPRKTKEKRLTGKDKQTNRQTKRDAVRMNL